MEEQQRLSICRACEYYGGDSTIDAKAHTLHCLAKGPTPTCSGCRALLLANSVFEGCPLNKWITAQEKETESGLPVLSVPTNICVHFEGVAGKNWGNCSIKYKNRPALKTCLSHCDKREIPNDTSTT